MESEMNTIVPDTPPWRYRSRNPPLRRNVNRRLFRRVLVAPISDFESSGPDPVVSVKESETVVPETLIPFEDSGTVETVLPFEDSTAVVPEMVLLFDDSDKEKSARPPRRLSVPSKPNASSASKSFGNITPISEARSKRTGVNQGPCDTHLSAVSKSSNRKKFKVLEAWFGF